MSEPKDTDELGQTATSKGGQAVNIRLIGTDKPLMTAVAVALALVAIFIAFAAERTADRVDAKSVYFIQRAEAFLEQLSAQGIKVPSDLLPPKEK